ncbi:ATP-grasp domain-containing protein [Methylobacillus gramineus]|uniref:ATP-grasp domain-containing protein n=1 Tax=Methylobacillus gramineus TaxID=755169 RepID=UPI001CFF8C00|nr:ATP-grasp domain-containing protein [Methylobacillus gramineus]MCB5184488.1 ATP-grasp domain-containing protein [Methylobacillus gramineus]
MPEQKPVKIFVCEYITSGGLYREELPGSLAQEALLMRDALLHDLASIDNVEVMIVSDARLPVPDNVEHVEILPAQTDPWPIWQQAMLEADLVWPVAPESDGVLYRLSQMIALLGKCSLSSPAEVVKIASSKYATFQLLHAAGMTVVDSHHFPSVPVASAWVAKPDDGAGCEDSHYFEHQEQLLEWLRQGRLVSHIIQPYIEGHAASISMLCKHGHAWVLSCNQQNVQLENDSFSYSGSVLNGMADCWQQFTVIASQVAQAMPQLFGYVGIDVIVDQQQQVHMLEVNPRLTTSYAGLHGAIGHNPARLILELFYNEQLQLPQDLQRNRVEVKLNV